MKWLLSVALAFSGMVGASGYRDLIFAIERAQSRVLVFAPSIYDRELGEVLRRARLDPIRTVTVRILSVPYYNYQPKSIMLSLALANVPVYEAQVASLSGFVIVDGQGWKGEELGRSSNSFAKEMTSQEINTALKWFKSGLSNANRLTQVEAFERLNKVTP
jgi:hypothetical protein